MPKDVKPYVSRMKYEEGDTVSVDICIKNMIQELFSGYQIKIIQKTLSEEIKLESEISIEVKIIRENDKCSADIFI